jgi:hypothetical protein
VRGIPSCESRHANPSSPFLRYTHSHTHIHTPLADRPATAVTLATQPIHTSTQSIPGHLPSRWPYAYFFLFYYRLPTVTWVIPAGVHPPHTGRTTHLPPRHLCSPEKPRNTQAAIPWVYPSGRSIAYPRSSLPCKARRGNPRPPVRCCFGKTNYPTACCRARSTGRRSTGLQSRHSANDRTAASIRVFG